VGEETLPSIYMPTDCHLPHSTGSFLSQSNPPYSRGLYYPDDRATESIEGFLRDGVKQRSCILESLRLTGRRLQWLAGISYENVLSIDQINAEWKTFTNRTRRYYDRGLCLFWIREATPSDPRRLHYHLAVSSGFCDDRETLHEVLRTCLSKFSDHHLWIDPRPVWSSSGVLTYMFKLAEGHDNEILLFKPGLKLHRHGHAGRVLPKGISKRTLERRINGVEKQVSNGATLLGHPELIRHISDFLQVPLKKVRRMVGEDPYNPVWESWMDSMHSLKQVHARTFHEPAP
jgi:hypothetical protein